MHKQRAGETSMQSEEERERQAQTERVMPLIGPLLDAWDQLPNDTKDFIEAHALSLYRAIDAIMEAQEVGMA